ncbi:purine and uridine phosphorylase, partial [Jackrogersella minutella]
MTTSFAPGLAFHQRFASPNSNSTEKMRIIPTAPPSVQEDEKPASAQPPACVIEQFTIGWICALQEEYQAACQMLDEELEPHDAETTIMNDESIYVFGKLGDHYVVVGCLPMGGTGIASATRVATDMARSFPNLKFALMVGIGGGAPNIAKKRDIRLGDVVVSVPQGQQAGVVQLDFGVRLPNGSFKRRGHLDAPPKALLGAIQEVQRRQQDRRKPDNLAEHIRRMENMLDYQRPPRDRLYKSSYNHQQATTDQTNDEDEFEDPCCNCLDEWLVRRRERNSFRQVTTHYGTIASDNVVMRDAKARDVHSSDENLNILCFEMEAAGLMNNLRCLVIRGICDYADSHKNDDWHNYAALVAAAYARELLLVLRKVHVTVMPSWVGEIRRS